jgi:hypothetical protein
VFVEKPDPERIIVNRIARQLARPTLRRLFIIEFRKRAIRTSESGRLKSKMSASPHGIPATSATGNICAPASSRMKLVPHSPISNTSVRISPTLWPPQPKDWKPIEFAVQVSKRENRALKNLVVSLSEIILKDIIGSQ